MEMRKLSVWLIVIAFVLPVFKPLLHAWNGKEATICRLSSRDCKHMDTCPLKPLSPDRERAHDMDGGDGHGCNVFFECGTDRDTTQIATILQDAYFAGVFFHIGPPYTAHTFLFEEPFLYVDPSVDTLDKPPAIV